MENVHPIAVHFPIALLVTAFLMDTLALVFKRPHWHRLALWNLVLGTFGAAAAVLSGRLAEAFAKHSFEIHEVLELHKRLGYIVLSLAAGITVLRVFLKDRLGGIARWVSWITLGLVIVLMGYSAHLGGRLVYEYGVGGVYGRSSGIEVTAGEP